MRSLIFVATLMFANFAQGNSCDIFGRINSAGLDSNPQFWDDFARLSDRGTPSETEITALIQKHTTAPPVVSVAAPVAREWAPRAEFAGSSRVQFTRNSEKGYNSSPPQVQRKADDLVRMFEERGRSGAIHELKAQPSWSFEYLKEHGVYSARLSGGYRATIVFEGEKAVLKGIGKDLYNH